MPALGAEGAAGRKGRREERARGAVVRSEARDIRDQMTKGFASHGTWHLPSFKQGSTVLSFWGVGGTGWRGDQEKEGSQTVLAPNSVPDTG